MTAPSFPSTTLDRKDFWALWFTLFLIAYNVSVIPPIMPLLVRQLDTSLDYIQGALVLFSLVTASFALTSENLFRFYGRERVFVTGLILYGMGTLAMALSPTIGFWVVSFSLWTGLAVARSTVVLQDQLFQPEPSESSKMGRSVVAAAG